MGKLTTDILQLFGRLRCGRRAWMGSESRPIIVEITHPLDTPVTIWLKGWGRTAWSCEHNRRFPLRFEVALTRQGRHMMLI